MPDYDQDRHSLCHPTWWQCFMKRMVSLSPSLSQTMNNKLVTPAQIQRGSPLLQEKRI
jgi:hypothetical protein